MPPPGGSRRCWPGEIRRQPVFDRALDGFLPTAPARAYDVKPLIAAMLDEPPPELHASWAPNLVTALGTLGGQTVGVLANNPLRLGGCLDAAAGDKAARFVRMCDAFGVPLLVVVDVPGYLPGTGQEWNGVVRRGAKLLHAFAAASVPRITLVTRKAYGGAYIAMNSRALGATHVLAWPSAQVDVMGAVAAVRILHRRQIAAVPDEEKPLLEARLAEEHVAGLRWARAARSRAAWSTRSSSPTSTRTRLARPAHRASVGPRHARKHPALMGLLDGKRLLITGVLTEASIAYTVAQLAQEQGADVVLTGFGRGLRITERIAKRLPEKAPVIELDVTSDEHLAALPERLREHVDGLDGVLHAIAFAPEAALGGNFMTTQLARRGDGRARVGLLAGLADPGGAADADPGFGRRRASTSTRPWPGPRTTGWASRRRAWNRPRATSPATSAASRSGSTWWPPGPLRTIAAKSIAGFENVRAGLGDSGPRSAGTSGTPVLLPAPASPCSRTGSRPRPARSSTPTGGCTPSAPREQIATWLEPSEAERGSATGDGLSTGRLSLPA